VGRAVFALEAALKDRDKKVQESVRMALKKIREN
jgi:hypothetical protein